MNIILGASGQIGSMLADNILKKGEPVRAVVRSSLKVRELKKKGAEVVTSDYFNVEDLKKAFHGGDSVFLITPENPRCENFLKETEIILNNFREAVLSSGITKIVGLSSIGAHNESGTGNLVASYMLEHIFSDIDIEQTYVRPTYYFSNWLGYVELNKHGILPTFFPPEMELPMIAPQDVAGFLSEAILCKTKQERIYEIIGPKAYSSLDIARIFEDVLNRKVTLQQVMPEEWEKTLMQAGFSKDGAKNLMLMTKAVIDGKTNKYMTSPICLPTDFKEYLKRIL